MHYYILTLLLLTGCAQVTWKTPCGEITRTALGSDLSAARTHIVIGADCSHSVTVDGAASLQSEAIKSAVQGAVEGAVKGMKP